MIEFEKLDTCPQMIPNLPIKVTEMGNVLELQYMSRRNNKQTIQMLPGGEQYVVCDSGEVRDIEHHQTRADDRKSLYKTFKLARAIINTNVTDVSCVRWITLTYAENMTDSKRLYEDFKKFNMRFQYYCKAKEYSKPEYIVMMEPQGRGAWHAHLLYIWESKAPFIPNEDLANIWGHGFTKIKKLDNVDNVGAYLTAYLGDMEVEDMEKIKASIRSGSTLKRVELEENGEPQTKYFIKGARLPLYPSNFNMIRYSKGIKKPTETFMCQEDAEKKASAGTLTFEKTVRLTDTDTDFECLINTRYYNTKRTKKQ